MKIIIFTLVLLSRPVVADTKKPDWNSSMRKMASNLIDLIPELARPEVFLSQEDKTKIIEKSKSFLKSVHMIRGNAVPPSNDPVLSMISGDLKSQIEGAIKKMESGRWSHGAKQMLDSSNNCIACHTLTAGPATALIKAKLET